MGRVTIIRQDQYERPYGAIVRWYEYGFRDWIVRGYAGGIPLWGITRIGHASEIRYRIYSGAVKIYSGLGSLKEMESDQNDVFYLIETVLPPAEGVSYEVAVSSPLPYHQLDSDIFNLKAQTEFASMNRRYIQYYRNGLVIERDEWDRVVPAIRGRRNELFGFGRQVANTPYLLKVKTVFPWKRFFMPHCIFRIMSDHGMEYSSKEYRDVIEAFLDEQNHIVIGAVIDRNTYERTIYSLH